MPELTSNLQEEGEWKNILSYQDVTGNTIHKEEQNEIETGTWEGLVTWTWEVYSSPRLSANDVLRDNPKPKVQEDKKQEVDINIAVLSGSTDNSEKDTEDASLDESESSLCKKPIIGPIWLWANNNTDEVERLEAFLIARWEQVEIDGVYWQDDFDAIKRFQLEYRADILDPWDIVNPTWYVYKTTVKKINEIACK